MVPVGYEFGFRRRLDVVRTRPGDWEETGTDLRDCIARVNAIKDAHPIFQEDGLIQCLHHPNPAVLVLWKGSSRHGSQALLILNKDPFNWQHFHAENLYDYIQAAPPLRDLSPEWPMDQIPTPFTYELPPAAARVLVAGA
jgi:starch synthase (maltosyl-transferring)